MNIYEVNPNSKYPDKIYPIKEENEFYYISTTGCKFPKKVVDTGKQWHCYYYFSNPEKANSFCDKFAKKWKEDPTQIWVFVYLFGVLVFGLVCFVLLRDYF
mgnify:CR=1 FL=1